MCVFFYVYFLFIYTVYKYIMYALKEKRKFWFEYKLSRTNTQWIHCQWFLISQIVCEMFGFAFYQIKWKWKWEIKQFLLVVNAFWIPKCFMKLNFRYQIRFTSTLEMGKYEYTVYSQMFIIIEMIQIKEFWLSAQYLFNYIHGIFYSDFLFCILLLFLLSTKSDA